VLLFGVVLLRAGFFALMKEKVEKQAARNTLFSRCESSRRNCSFGGKGDGKVIKDKISPYRAYFDRSYIKSFPKDKNSPTRLL